MSQAPTSITQTRPDYNTRLDVFPKGSNRRPFSKQLTKLQEMAGTLEKHGFSNGWFLVEKNHTRILMDRENRHERLQEKRFDEISYIN